MRYVSVNYNYSPDFNSPESWVKRTRAYTGILEILAKKNTVIAIKQIDYKGVYTYNGVEHHFVEFGKKKNLFPLKLNRYIKNLDPDIIILQGLHNSLQFIQLYLLLKKNTKIIAQHHAEKPFTGIKKYLQKLADRYIDAYLFASHDMGMDWVKKGNLSSPQKIHEVMELSSVFYPIEKTTALAKTGATGSSLFLWVGRLNANKDPLNVVKAFFKFTYSRPTATLYMIYHTDELLTEIIELAKGHPNKNAVHLVGKVPNDELLYWYNSADFIVSGSHYEGSGTAICEAMSCGCVPVVTSISSFRMITDNGNCGLLYEAGNEDALLAVLKQSQQVDMQEKRKLSLDYFKSNLSFEAIAGRIEKIAASL
jgi:glycosyltransferase involved in cell wall biosynthesis